MKTLLPILKQLIIWFFPFIGLNIYLSACYNVSIYELSLWWFDNFSFTVNVIIKLIAFTILFILFSLQFTSLLNSMYLGIFAHKHSVVFLGCLIKNTTMNYLPKDKEKKVICVRSYKQEFNYSFDDVNRLKTFIKLPFTENTLINSRQHFHPYSILSRTMLMLFFAMPTLAAIHALAFPAYVPDQSRGLILSDDAMVSFDQVLSIFNLNLFTSAVVFFFALMLAIYFSSKQQDDSGKQVEPLPENICAKSIVTGKPLIMVKSTIEKFESNSNVKSLVDTGFRRVSFEFSQEFNPPVFVTLKFDSNKYPGLEERIQRDIKYKKPMDLELTDKLRLKIIEKEEEAAE
jgi:hypothetical protein